MKRIVILGAGESGTGAAILAKKKGFDVFVSEQGVIKEKYKELLEAHSIIYEEHGHTLPLLLNADEVIKSPGIPENTEAVKAIREKGIPILDEIEFAGRYTDAKLICITGSNGKTTTTSLIYHIFKQAGYHVGLAGNIGRSFALQVAEANYDYYIIELSSFQLEGMYQFKADVAVLLNITPDHLDRYGHSLSKYADAKMRIVQNQTAADAFVYWDEDPIIQSELARFQIASRKCAFSQLKGKGCIAYLEDGEYKIEYPTPFNMEQENLALTGRHNLYNSLAAGLSARLMGIQDEHIRAGLSSFTGVTHRLEKVATVRSVLYIDDSKATNVDACYFALESMTTPTVLILGGTDKGNDYAPLLPLIQERCRALVYLGADNAKLHTCFDGLGLPVADTHTMKDCVAACYRLAQPGDTVLLSPCCASFDLFRDMGDRGNQFKECVRRL